MCFVRMSVNFLQIFRVICQKSYSVLVPKIICGGLLRIWLGYFSMLLGVKNNKWNNLQSFAIFQSVVICFFNFWSTPKMFKKSYQMTINYMATHSSTLAWKIPWMEQPGGLQSMGSRRVRHDSVTSLSLFTFMHGEGNDNPPQCSCLENPRDGGAWWAAVYGIAQSQTRLKRLSSSSSRRV